MSICVTENDEIIGIVTTLVKIITGKLLNIRIRSLIQKLQNGIQYVCIMIIRVKDLQKRIEDLLVYSNFRQ